MPGIAVDWDGAANQVNEESLRESPRAKRSNARRRTQDPSLATSRTQAATKGPSRSTRKEADTGAETGSSTRTTRTSPRKKLQRPKQSTITNGGSKPTRKRKVDPFELEAEPQDEDTMPEQQTWRPVNARASRTAKGSDQRPAAPAAPEPAAPSTLKRAIRGRPAKRPKHGNEADAETEPQPRAGRRASESAAQEKDVDGEDDNEDASYRSGQEEDSSEDEQAVPGPELPEQDQNEMDDDPRLIGSYNARRRLFLGKHGAWSIIWEAQRKNYSGERLKSSLLKAISSSLTEVLTTYRAISNEFGTYQSFLELNQELRRKIDQLVEAVGRLTKDAANPQTVQQLCVFIIPRSIQILEEAMLRRSTQNVEEDPYDPESLREIIALQTTALDLCDNVDTWKISPAGDAPVLGNVVRKMRPYLRSMLDAFKKKLRERERTLAQQRLSQPRPQRQATPEDVRRQRQDAEHQDFLRRAHEDMIQQGRRLGFSLPTSSSQHIPSLVNNRSDRTIQWSKAQDDALIDQVFAKMKTRRIRKMSPQDIILTLLNTPELQEFLPGHIRERILFHKTGFEAVYMQYGKALPHFIANIA